MFLVTRTSVVIQRVVGWSPALLLAACAGFHTPLAATLDTIGPMPLASLVPGPFEVDLATPGLTGTFDAVCAVDRESFRIQLFPDIGGKVLDVLVGAESVTAEWPGGRYVAQAPLDRAEPHLALVLAALFAELLAPVAGSRVLGERDAGDGRVEVQLRPALGRGQVVARLDAAGAIDTYQVTLGWITFAFDGAGFLRGRGLSGQLRRRGAG